MNLGGSRIKGLVLLHKEVKGWSSGYKHGSLGTAGCRLQVVI